MRRLGVSLVLLVVTLAACSSDSPELTLERSSGERRTTTTAPPTTTTTTAPPTTTTTRPPVALPSRPVAANDAASLSRQIVAAETTLRTAGAPPEQLSAAGHLQQVTARQLVRHPEWMGAVLARVPVQFHGVLRANVGAGTELASMLRRPKETLPAWRIVAPAPAAELLGYYREAGAAFNVGWEYLAAIHLVETRMGRIRGVSSAGAQGPMQFLPSTWAAFGRGDINNNRDAIHAAARYLAHNGAPATMDKALWNYNHDNRYVRAVSAYAEKMRKDPRTYHGYHGWEVYYTTVKGDILLPVGYASATERPL